MTDEDAISLAERVEVWQHRLAVLGLGHWRIEGVTICDEVPGVNGSEAAVQPSFQYDSATFWFRADFVENAAEQVLDETIIHEWLHVAMRNLDQAMDSINDSLSPAAREVWQDRINFEREVLIDRLARQIYALHSER